MTIPTRRTAVSKAVVAAAAALSVLGGSFAGLAPAAAAPGDVVNPLEPKSYRYSSEFGARCIPVVNGSTNHLGQDMAASDGTAIRAIADGQVTTVRNPANGGSGYLGIRHVIDGKVVYSGYYHMWQATKYVKVGQKVKKGERIALVGNSGPSTAPHLHFEIWQNAFHGTGRAINPTPWMKAQGVDLKVDASLVYSLKTPSTCTYYFGSDTVLRATPSTAGTVVKSVKRNTPMTSVPGTASQSGSFVKVTVGGVTGWAARSTVSPRKVAVPAPVAPKPVAPKPETTPANVKYKTTDKLSVRKGAGVSHALIRELPKGTQVVTTGAKSGSWFQIKAGTTTGWVHSGYLAKVAAPAPAKPSATTTMAVHLRSTPAWAGTSLAVVKKGATVQPTGKTSGVWKQVKSGSKTGWIAGNYLKTVTK